MKSTKKILAATLTLGLALFIGRFSEADQKHMGEASDGTGLATPAPSSTNTKKIDQHGYCRMVTSGEGVRGNVQIFYRTLNEWLSFIRHPPRGVTLADCVPPSPPIPPESPTPAPTPGGHLVHLCDQDIDTSVCQTAGQKVSHSNSSSDCYANGNPYDGYVAGDMICAADGSGGLTLIMKCDTGPSSHLGTQFSIPCD